MSNDWKPTGRLRFVMRREPVKEYVTEGDQTILTQAHGVRIAVTKMREVQVLQQEWSNIFPLLEAPPEWRDVPLEKESSCSAEAPQ